MKRREIIEAAKRLVITNGPANVLEFGDELIENYTDNKHPHWINRDAIVEEANFQALRVYDFLGFARKY